MPTSIHGLVAVCCLAFSAPALAQMPGGGEAPAVGVVTVRETEQGETTEFNGRIGTTDLVNGVARVSAFLEEQLFVEGADVIKGGLRSQLERPPYEADVEVQEATVAQAQTQIENANTARDRAEQLCKSGSENTLDNALAAPGTATAQLRFAHTASSPSHHG